MLSGIVKTRNESLNKVLLKKDIFNQHRVKRKVSLTEINSFNNAHNPKGNVTPLQYNDNAA